MTRVLLTTGLPRLLHDILVGLAKSREGLEVVDAVLSQQEVAARVRATGSDIVVFGREDRGLPRWAIDLLEHFPRLRFLVLDTQGRSGDLYELRLAHVRIDGISPDALIAALHGPGPPEGGWRRCTPT